jgi:NADPH:quinone reductase-like Zn-dependent oxidoreductase
VLEPITPVAGVGFTEQPQRTPRRSIRQRSRRGRARWECPNLAPLPADVDHIVAAAVLISGLTAWQALFDHARLEAGQTVLIHGAGGVGSIAVQLAREVGAVVIDAGQVDVVFDVIGGDILDRSAALVRVGGTLVTITRAPTVQPPIATAAIKQSADASTGVYGQEGLGLRGQSDVTFWGS